MIRLTRRGVAVLVGAIVVFVIGQLAGYPVLLAVSAAALGAVIAAVAVISKRPKVTVSREVYPERVQRDRPAFASLRVRNTGTRRQAGFSAGDRVGTGFHAVTVRALAAGGDAVYRYELPTHLRGRHKVGPLTLDRIDPLGLSFSRLTTGDTATMWVHPRIYPVRAIAGGHPRHHHEGSRADDDLRGSLDVREVREYVPGDEVRHLHWKAIARTGRLMVRDYVDPDQPRFTALLDSRVGPAFEDSVDLAASLVFAASSAEHRCRLVTSCGIDVATNGGAKALRRLLDELCLLEPAKRGGTNLVPESLRGSGGGRLVVICAQASASDGAAIAALRPRFSTLTMVAIGTGDPPRVPGVTVLPAVDAEDAARRWNTVIA